jgi:hypothetical protein
VLFGNVSITTESAIALKVKVDACAGAVCVAACTTAFAFITSESTISKFTNQFLVF